MTTVYRSPPTVLQFFNNAGQPNIGGTLLTQVGGVNYATYQDSAGTTPLPNPIPLNSRGEVSNASGVSCELWLASGVTYTFTLYDANGNQIGVYSNINGINDNSTLSGNIGASLVGFLQQGTGAVLRTVQAKLYETISVTDFGVDNTGVNDSTTAIQKAINAAGAGGTVIFPSGTYLVSSTINVLSNQSLIGAGPNSTIIYRTGDYGDTLSYANAGAGKLSGIWFRHSVMYAAGDTTLANRIVAFPSSAHIHVQNAQNLLIENCWAWRMPYQIKLDQGSLITIRSCNIQGTWDGAQTATEEGIAGVFVGATGYIQIVKIVDCYFGGSGSAVRNITYTSADTGAHTIPLSQNVGNQYGLLIYQCEDFVFDNNYVGGNWVNNILASVVASATADGWRITNNFFDSAGYNAACVQFSTQQNASYATGVTISNNFFNGELQGFQGLSVFNALGTASCLSNFTIADNFFVGMVGSAIMLYNAYGGVVSGNSITGYNARNYSNGTTDLTFTTGIYASANSHNVLIANNLCGGTTNSVASPSYCYHDVVTTGTDGTVIERNNFVVGGSLTGAITGRKDAYVQTLTASGNYTLLGNEDILLINKTTGGATQVNAPVNGVPVGYKVTIKDAKGDAATNNITFAVTVDGAGSSVINTAYGFHTYVFNPNATWSIVA